VRDPAVHRAILREVRDALGPLGLAAAAAIVSPLRGPAGNIEFFYHIVRSGVPVDDARIDALVTEAHGPEV
jgi:23S rRNA (cytidine1920-2'-O)/16S rRNA (cytidine1409-2'-O)-methyltransferase